MKSVTSFTTPSYKPWRANTWTHHGRHGSDRATTASRLGPSPVPGSSSASTGPSAAPTLGSSVGAAAAASESSSSSQSTSRSRGLTHGLPPMQSRFASVRKADTFQSPLRQSLPGEAREKQALARVQTAHVKSLSQASGELSHTAASTWSYKDCTVIKTLGM